MIEKLRRSCRSLKFEVNMRFLLFLALLCTFSSVSSQNRNFNTENLFWHDGELLLMDGTLIKGKLNYNFVSQSLRLIDEDEIKILTANRILQFKYANNDTTITYYSLPYISQEYYDRPRATFFKVIYKTDEYAVICRNLLEYNDKAFGPFSTLRGDEDIVALGKISSEKIYEEVYIADSNGKIIPVLRGKKNNTLVFKEIMIFNEDVLGAERKFNERKADDDVTNYKIESKHWKEKLFKDDEKLVKNYIKENKIKEDTVEGLVEIVEYYSSLN